MDGVYTPDTGLPQLDKILSEQLNNAEIKEDSSRDQSLGVTEAAYCIATEIDLMTWKSSDDFDNLTRYLIQLAKNDPYVALAIMSDNYEAFRKMYSGEDAMALSVYYKNSIRKALSKAPQHKVRSVYTAKNMIKEIVTILENDCCGEGRRERIDRFLAKRQELVDFSVHDKGTDRKSLVEAISENKYLMDIYPEFKNTFSESPLFPVLFNHLPPMQAEINEFIQECANLGMNSDEILQKYHTAFAYKLCVPKPAHERRSDKLQTIEASQMEETTDVNDTDDFFEKQVSDSKDLLERVRYWVKKNKACDNCLSNNHKFANCPHKDSPCALHYYLSEDLSPDPFERLLVDAFKATDINECRNINAQVGNCVLEALF